jgi:cysteinyl-tRNA synthetase
MGSNENYAGIAAALHIKLSKKKKSELAIMLANHIVKSMIEEEARNSFLTDLATERVNEKLSEHKRRAELADQALRALEFNWSVIRDLQREIGSAPQRLARRGGEAKAKKIEALRNFACELFKSRNWKSTRQARDALFPEIREEGRKLGVELTETTGPETVYRWLRESKRGD